MEAAVLNRMTPASIVMIQKILSILFEAEMSPYPTVVIVVTVQYIEVRYFSFVGLSSISFASIHVPL